jgi:hypothetical protein
MKTLKVSAHKMTIKLVKRMMETEDREAHLDTQVKEALVSIMSDTGRRKPLSNILVTIAHEIAHEMDYCTGHEVFCDNNDEQRDIKENALDALCETAIQVLLDNNLLNPTWIKAVKDEINRVWTS